MICPTCQANMGKLNLANEPMLRGRGLVLKATHVAMICPKCGEDAPIVGDLAKALAARLLLVFRSPSGPA